MKLKIFFMVCCACFATTASAYEDGPTGQPDCGPDGEWDEAFAKCEYRRDDDWDEEQEPPDFDDQPPITESELNDIEDKTYDGGFADPEEYEAAFGSDGELPEISDDTVSEDDNSANDGEQDQSGIFDDVSDQYDNLKEKGETLDEDGN